MKRFNRESARKTLKIKIDLFASFAVLKFMDYPITPAIRVLREKKIELAP